MFLYIGVVTTTLTLIGVGIFLLAQNKRSQTIESFAAFVLLTALWVIANFVGANLQQYHLALYFSYADFLVGSWVAYSFWLFARSLLRQVGVRLALVLERILLGCVVLSSVLVASGLIVRISWKSAALIVAYQDLFWLYSLLLSSIAVLSLAAILVARKRAKNPLRQQLRIMVSTLVVVAVMVVFANLLLPQLTGSRRVNLLVGNTAYLGVALFAVSTTYAIVRHRLFDIRLIVARSIGYTASLAALTIVYAVFVAALSVIFTGRSVPIGDQAIYISAAIVVALSFAPLKKRFDRLTNAYFYRDAYDPRSLFDDYNKALVSTLDLGTLLDRTLHVVVDYLKVEYCLAIVEGIEIRKEKIVGNHDWAKGITDILENLPSRISRSMLVTDELAPEYEDLQNRLYEHEVGIVVQLLSTSGSRREHLGSIVFGQKKSGNSYMDQDIKVIEALANELTIALQNALRFEEIERFNETLQKEIEVATRKLRESNKKLKQLNESKDDFIGMTSHQLRTPLSTIKGYISLVMDGDAGEINETQHKLLAQAFSSSQKMVHLIADLLNVSRLKTGKFTIERKPTNLALLIKEELAQLQEEFASHGLTLTSELPKKFPELPLDDTKTRQVVMNFLDNAIYYTPTGGHIRVELKELPKSVEFRVTDSGIGVPKEERRHLFTKFYRAKNALRTRPDGTGLGLYMARKVITAQGGAIIFDSTEGQGSTFGFTFPKDLADMVASAKDPLRAPGSVAEPVASLAE